MLVWSGFRLSSVTDILVKEAGSYADMAMVPSAMHASLSNMFGQDMAIKTSPYRRKITEQKSWLEKNIRKSVLFSNYLQHNYDSLHGHHVPHSFFSVWCPEPDKSRWPPRASSASGFSIAFSTQRKQRKQHGPQQQ
eukprot:TRINITY_DN19062_c0_g1_i1.p2 TRINITY_DN19062_c0_g1~~TRINITY_DN19062_c0_g1_i1.p2  ORF type:complete len:136 (+),score=11.84 TRINITY_DN19062_c0_g1_i1:25-432(+)